MKYISIPTEIEATQWFFGVEIPGVRFTTDKDSGWLSPGLAYVVTIHGQRAYLDPGDWVVTEPTNPDRHYPVKPDVFKMRYRAKEPTV